MIGKNILNIITLWSILFFVSLGLYCASSNGYLPLVHGPYYFSIAQSLFYNQEINYYAIYPPVKSLVYTLQIGISYIEYLILHISEKYWYLIFYAITSLMWIIAIIEFFKFESKNILKADKVILAFTFFFQPYNLNQLANFSNEAIYFPFLIYFYFSFFRYVTTKNKNYYYITLFSLFVIFGIFFRLHHVILCINFFIFLFYLKNKKIIFGILFLGLLNIIIFAIVINSTYLETVFNDHLAYVGSNTGSTSIDISISNGIVYLEKFFKIITYPILLNKFTNNQFIMYLFGIIFSSVILYGYILFQKNNKKFNFFSLVYLFLSIIFVLLLPPFEYTYILPFSFLLFLYCFVVFKKIFKDAYINIFIILVLISSSLTAANYFIFGKNNVEGFEYRIFMKDIKENYPKETQNQIIFYAAEDVFDHIEDFYWQQKYKRPYCQLTVKISECRWVQKANINFDQVIVIGKNPHNIFDFGSNKPSIIVNAIESSEIGRKLEIKLKLKDVGFKFKSFYQSKYFYHYTFEDPAKGFN